MKGNKTLHMLLIIHYSNYQCRSCWQQNAHRNTAQSTQDRMSLKLTLFPPKYRSRRI